jgi:ribosomal protein L18
MRGELLRSNEKTEKSKKTKEKKIEGVKQLMEQVVAFSTKVEIIAQIISDSTNCLQKGSNKLVLTRLVRILVLLIGSHRKCS